MLVIVMIIVGILVVVLGIKRFSKGIAELGVIIVCMALLGELLGTGNTNASRDWKLHEQIQLVSLSNGLATQGGGFMYVSVSAENAYSYRYEIDSKFGSETSKEYVVDVVSGNVEEIEDINCETPVLLKYKNKLGISKWRIILPGEATKYVFYVPEGTISHEIKLN